MMRTRIQNPDPDRANSDSGFEIRDSDPGRYNRPSPTQRNDSFMKIIIVGRGHKIVDIPESLSAKRGR